MYLPAHFREERSEVLHAFIREHGFATLITMGPEGLTADHVPLLLDASAGPHGTLRGHVARSNPVWKTRRADVGALAVFHGPQGYVTPAWYPTKAETGKVVPTWNYTVVHAHGPLVIRDDAAWLRRLVTDLTERHESARPNPWHVTDAPEDFIQQMLKAIVGIEIPITRLEGKFKASQNRPLVDRAGVVAGLRERGEGDDASMATLVERGAA